MSKSINVFISVDDEDAAVAKTLHRDLKDKGVSPFMEQEDLLPGQHQDNTVNRAIRESDYFITLKKKKNSP